MYCLLFQLLIAGMLSNDTRRGREAFKPNSSHNPFFLILRERLDTEVCVGKVWSRSMPLDSSKKKVNYKLPSAKGFKMIMNGQ